MSYKVVTGRATCFNNGIDPGFANDTMPLTFTGLSEYWSNGDHAVAGVIQTATTIVNAVPAVVQQAPGLVSAMDLPKITGKGLYRPG
jgi:hypothetical protein